MGVCVIGHSSSVRSVAFSLNSKKIASGSDDYTIRLLDAESATLVGISREIGSSIRSVSFIGDGDRIVSGSEDGIDRIWNARLQTESKEQFHRRSCYATEVTISRDGARVCSAWFAVQMWDAEAGGQIGPQLEGHNRQ